MRQRTAPARKDEQRRFRSAPALRQQIHVPARLRGMLAGGLNAGLIHVQAPAGCGKTAVVLQFLLDQHIDPYWHTCSAEDADPASLLAGIVTAMGGSETPGGRTALAAIAATEVVQSYRTVLAPFFVELHEENHPPVLVIDDADAMLEAPASTDALDYLLSALEPYARVILISRADLPLPSQARRLLDGRAVRINADDLLLHENEIVACAREAYGIAVNHDEAAALFRATAGWAIALRLALRLRDLGAPIHADAQAMFTPEARTDLFAYLAREVLSNIDDRTVHFLRRTAVLETLDPAICARLTGEERAVQLIQSLPAAGLPVMKSGWSAYRCHSLLREYLLAELTAKDLQHAHVEAARAYHDAEEWPRALHHLAAADDVESALAVADENGRELFFNGHGRALLEIARNAPPELLDRHERAHYWAAFAAARSFQLEWAAAAFEHVHATATGRGDTSLARDALRALTQLLNGWGRYPAATEAAQRLVDALPEHDTSGRAAARLGYLITSMGATDKFREAIALIRELLPQLSVEPRADAVAEAYARAVAGGTLAMEGDFASARAEVQLARVLIVGREQDDIHTFVPWMSALVEFMASEPGRADEFALSAENLALQFGDLQRVLECRALRASTATMRGNVDQADRMFAELDALRAGGADYWGIVLTLLSRPERARLHGDLAGALSAAEANHALASSLGGARFICSTRLDVSYLRMLSGDAAPAREHARAALAEARALDAALVIYGANLMLAASSPDDAATAMQEALAVADERDYRFLMPYAVRLPQLEAALWRALDGPHGSRAAILLTSVGPSATKSFHHVASSLSEDAALRAVAVLHTFGGHGRRALDELASSRNGSIAHASRRALASLDDANPHRLSEREREVLALLVAGMRTKDIAERLVLTPATISTHVQRIMNKTGTLSRAELVALAAREVQAGVN